MFLGDSAVEGYPKGRDVATQLAAALDARRPGRFEVLSLALPGMGPLEYFSLADTILKTHPDRIVISFNVASLSPIARNFWSRREIAGWIPPRRLGAALRLPLQWWDITLDRLLLYVALVRLDLTNAWYRWRWEQLRAGHAPDAVRAALQRAASLDGDGMPPPPDPYDRAYRNRFSAPFVRAYLGDAANGAAPDHPVLQLLAASIETFRSRGIDVLVYATPTNVEYQERVGIDTHAGIDLTVANAKELALRHGATFVDLHRMFPDAAFRDHGEHLTYEGRFDGPRVLAERLADELLPRADGRRPRAGR